MAFAALTLWLFSTALGQEQQANQSQKYAELARRIVSTSANIKPGEVVVISGGKHTIPLMEALAIESQKAGGLVNMFLYSDIVERSYFIDVPEKYLEIEPRFFAEWLKTIDVWISLPGVEDHKAIYADIPEARFAKASKASQVIQGMLNEAKIKEVDIGYPTKEEAANNKIDFAAFEKMHWAAVNADYKQISEKGRTLKGILKGAKSVRVTSPAGTDFTFSVGNRPIFVDDGIITAEKAKSKFFLERIATLPGGCIFFAPIEISGNGKVVVPKNQCRSEPMTGVSFEFKKGKMQNFKAEKGAECFNETMAPYSGPKDMLSEVWIGLNPELKVIEDGGDYRPDSAAGLVWVGVGDNRLTGGKNDTLGGFYFPIVNATVLVDGKEIIKDGKLVF
jgi:leucyl aminopeptidase (aminopeptidase T)